MDFSRDKEKLLKTLKKFDGKITVDEVTDSKTARNHAKYLHTLLIQALLEQICYSVEPNENIREHLFNEVVRRVTELQYLNQSVIIDDLMPLRRHLVEGFLKIVKKVHREIVPNVKDNSITADAFLDDHDFSTRLQFRNKYEPSFEELEIIAKGGFGTVCKARHKIDGRMYAVKKIIFKYKSDSDYMKVIREAKSIAALNHLNVVSYNNAWVECLPKFCQENSSSDSSGNDSDESVSVANENSAITHIGYSSSSTAKRKVSSSQNALQRNDEYILMNNSRANQYSSDSTSVECLSTSTSSTKVSFCSQSSSICFEENSVPIAEDKCVHQTSHNANNSSSSSDTLNLENSETFWNLKKLNIKAMLCIQMEYCDYDLHFWLNKRAKGQELPFQMDVIRIFKDILQGLEYVHSKGVIHRDLKPKNIFYSKERNVMKIGDFGLATLTACSSEDIDGVVYGRHSSNLGTIPYAAPEQRRGCKYNSKVDIYSLGIILIELLNCFTTNMEMMKVIEQIREGNFPEDMIKNWPNYISLVKNLVEKQPESRMSAKEIVELPVFQDELKVNRIIELEEALSAKEKALFEKESALCQMKNALSEKESALTKRESALTERENALSERENALHERENALSEKVKAISEKENSLSQNENY